MLSDSSPVVMAVSLLFSWQDATLLRHHYHHRSMVGSLLCILLLLPCRYYGRNATRDDYIGRMYNITRQSNLNVNNCDWLASDCSVNPNPCESQNVPFANWFADSSMCPLGNATVDVNQTGPAIKRGERLFVRDPKATVPGGVAGEAAMVASCMFHVQLHAGVVQSHCLL